MLLSYVVKRVLLIIPMLFALSVLIFFIIQLPPGDYISTYINQLELSGTTVDPATIENIKAMYGLDRSPVEQYFFWIGNILFRGDFGRSIQWNVPVTELVGERIGWTMLVSLSTLLVSYLIAIPVGIFAATHKYAFGDYLITFIGFIGMAVPGFLLALVILYLIFVHTGEAFVGLFSQEYVLAPWSVAKLLDMLPRYLLCVGIIGLTRTAEVIRTMRAMTLDELEKQYVTTARAKGLEEKKMLWKYPIRMAVNPICSTIGWSLPALISGEIVVSIVMSLPTIGPLIRTAFMVQDTYLAGSLMLFTGALTIIGTLLSDILLCVVDPRIRFGGVTE